MKVLLLGVGMQGRAALGDLVAGRQVKEIVAADADIDALENYVEISGWRDRVRRERIDAADNESIDRLMAQKPDVALDLLPPRFVVRVAESAVRHGVHLVNTCFVRPGIEALADEALARDVTILPECGLDPGIDLLLLGDAVRALDEVEEIRSYGSGIPEADAADNPIRYKVTWSFEGVLGAYCRPARQIRDGEIVDIDGKSLFEPKNVSEMEIDGLGRLEAYPNGDALPIAERLGLDPRALRHLGCYTMRHPGHCDFWKKLVELHLLDNEPVMIDGVPVDRRRFLAKAIAPHIKLGRQERDVIVLLVEVTGLLGGRRTRIVRQLVDRRDLATGITAMSRTVGFTASIGAQLVGSGGIASRGLITPIRDVPFDRFIRELGKRNIQIHSF
ncbi:MAG: hypothetical protein GY854_23560 [Deltaproteobacteria bacterium]|nr:hypothetical protein [Deltaproteobacteria bacterium]